MAILLTVILFSSGIALLLRWHLQKDANKPLSAAQVEYAKLVDATIGKETRDMKQTGASRRDHVERLTSTLTMRGLFRTGEMKDVLDWLDRRLELAGRPKGWSASEAVVFCLIVWVAAGGVTLVAFLSDVPGWIVGACFAVAAAYPHLKLNAMIKRRQEQAKLEMPSFISDLIMGIGSSSGTLDDAIARTVNDPAATGADRILVREFAQAYAEYRHGSRDREEALRDAANRLGLDVVHNFVDAIIEGLRTGTPVKSILQSQSQQIQAIFEQDMKAYIARKQSSFVISLIFIFFGIIVLVMAPLFMRLGGVFAA